MITCPSLRPDTSEDEPWSNSRFSTWLIVPGWIDDIDFDPPPSTLTWLKLMPDASETPSTFPASVTALIGIGVNPPGP